MKKIKYILNNKWSVFILSSIIMFGITLGILLLSQNYMIPDNDITLSMNLKLSIVISLACGLVITFTSIGIEKSNRYHEMADIVEKMIMDNDDRNKTYNKLMELYEFKFHHRNRELYKMFQVRYNSPNLSPRPKPKLK